MNGQDGEGLGKDLIGTGGSGNEWVNGEYAQVGDPGLRPDPAVRLVLALHYSLSHFHSHFDIRFTLSY